MKKIVLASLLALGLSSGVVYAEHAAVVLEHANKTADDATESISGDMSAMKAAGKCNADQKAKSKVPKKKDHAKKKTKAELEIEHANKLKSEPDGVAGDMGNMKAQGKCGSN